MSIAHERFASVANPFDGGTSAATGGVARRATTLSATCWTLAVALAAVQVTCARQTITHDLCLRATAPVVVITSPAKYAVVLFGAIAFLVIVVYYAGKKSVEYHIWL